VRGNPHVLHVPFSPFIRGSFTGGSFICGGNGEGLGCKTRLAGFSGSAKDTLGITIWDGSGALVFSSYWDSITKTTKEQAMGGGNLQVH
jgi:hypothetical protein